MTGIHYSEHYTGMLPTQIFTGMSIGVFWDVKPSTLVKVNFILKMKTSNLYSKFPHM